MFAPSNNPNNTRSTTVENIAFYMPINIADFCADTRTTDTITDGRVERAIRAAIIETNNQLAPWQELQEFNSITNIRDIPSDDYDNLTAIQHHYINAVYSLSKYKLVMQYRDVDTSTPSGYERADEMKNTADDYLANHRADIAIIMGKNSVNVVSLI